MSNIEFMKSCTECIKALFDRYMSEGVKKIPNTGRKARIFIFIRAI